MSFNLDKVLKLAKGFQGRGKNCNKIARQTVQKSLENAYIGRRLKKRSFRALWIQTINAGVRQYGMNYASFIHGLVRADIRLDRKSLSELVKNEPFSFKALVLKVQDSLASLGRPMHGKTYTPILPPATSSPSPSSATATA